MDVSTLKTKNHSKKNWFLQSCDSCDQRNEKMEDRMISSFEPTGLVFIVPHRHDKPKQSTCLFYQSIKNHLKKHDLRIIDNQEMMTIQEVTWRRYLESIRTSVRNARGMENITQELTNTLQETISSWYVRMFQRTRNDSKSNWHIFLTKTHLWVWNFLNQKYQKFWCPQIVKKNLMGCLEC